MSSGQWYIISAAFVASALFALSIFFRGYFVASPADIITIDEDYYFKDVSYCLQRTPEDKLEEFKYFSENEMHKIGIYADITASDRKLAISSQHMEIEG